MLKSSYLLFKDVENILATLVKIESTGITYEVAQDIIGILQGVSCSESIQDTLMSEAKNKEKPCLLI